MVVQYKCPNCGGNMSYDIEKDSLYCPYCDSVMKVPDVAPVQDVPEGDTEDELKPEAYEAAQIENDAEYEYKDDGTHIKEVFGDDAVEYLCKNCGAVIMTGADTAATWCCYCDSPVVIGDRLTGQLAPTYVIPFKVTKETAQKAFEDWSKKGLFTPKRFRDLKKVKEIQGLYAPYWLFDMSGKGEADASAVISRSYTRGDYIYTEKKHYHVYRRASLNYIKVPADASSRLDDSIMDLLEPYDYREMQQFTMPYLAGFAAEKYNYTDEQLQDRVKARIDNSVKEYIKDSVKGYSSVSYNVLKTEIEKKNADYSLFPVWIFSYDYQDKEHIFVMNGQTGKIVGKLPVDPKRVAGFFGLFFAGALALMQIFQILSVLL